MGILNVSVKHETYAFSVQHAHAQLEMILNMETLLVLLNKKRMGFMFNIPKCSSMSDLL